MTHAVRRFTMPGAAALVLASTVTLAAQPQPLPLSGPATGSATDAAAAEYTFEAKTAGILSVAVQGTGDLALALVDEDGQAVPDGTSDRDMNGSQGTELLSATITEAGVYRVRVRLQGSGSSKFEIAAGFLAFPPFARRPDPDRRPAQARALVIGKPFDDSLDPAAGDSWDWFVFKAARAGALALITRPLANTEADLILEVYTGGDFSASTERSDQDMQGNTSNESATINVEAGEMIHVKVINQSGSTASKYRLSSSLIE
jgi:hypothetical protein